MTNMEYPYIVAWGKNLHSFDYYIDNQVEKAKKDNAPKNAVYKRDDGTWVKITDCHIETQKRIQSIVDNFNR